MCVNSFPRKTNQFRYIFKNVLNWNFEKFNNFGTFFGKNEFSYNFQWKKMVLKYLLFHFKALESLNHWDWPFLVLHSCIDNPLKVLHRKVPFLICQRLCGAAEMGVTRVPFFGICCKSFTDIPSSCLRELCVPPLMLYNTENPIKRLPNKKKQKKMQHQNTATFTEKAVSIRNYVTTNNRKSYITTAL